MPRVYTEEQRQRKKEYQKEYYQKNKETIYEKTKKYMKEYREKNKEKQAERDKEWGQSPKGKRSRTITDWKRRGVVSTDYNLLYDNYLASANCEECGIEYSKKGDGVGTFKCLDHCHETGLFRNYLCNGCNTKRR